MNAVLPPPPTPTDEQLTLLFDSMLPIGKTWFTAKEVAAMVDVAENSIHNAFFQEDSLRRLLGFGFNFDGDDLRIHKRIPRALLLVWLIRRGNFTTDILRGNLRDLAQSLTPVAFGYLAEFVQERQRTLQRR